MQPSDRPSPGARQDPDATRLPGSAYALIGDSLNQSRGEAISFERRPSAIRDFLLARRTPESPDRWFILGDFEGDHRSNDDWLVACGAQVDIDYCDEHGAHEATPDALESALREVLPQFPLPGVAFTTARGVRWICILSTDVCVGSTYEALVSALGKRLAEFLEENECPLVGEGLAGLSYDSSSEILAQPMRLPRVGTEIWISGEDRAINPSDLGLSDDWSPKESPFLDMTGSPERAQLSAPDEVALLQSALPYISASERPIWLRVGMALQHGLSDGVAHDLWREWSLTCPDKYDAKDQERAWRSFKSDRANPVTLGTIYELAKQNGWVRRASDSYVGSAQVGSEKNAGASVGSDSRGRGDIENFDPPEPIATCLPPVPEFDRSILPARLTEWIQDIVDRVQCPIEFVAVAMMVALASVIGRKVGIRPKRKDTWTVVLNLWGVLIGRPGIMKTPALQESTQPLKRLELLAKDQHAKERSEFETACLIENERQKVVKKQIKAALSDGGDPSDLARSLTESAPQESRRQRFIVNDTTVEMLGQLLNENPNGLLIYRDELMGFLRYLEKDGHEADRAFYLESWNGNGRYTYDRIGRGTVDIEAAIVSIIGSIQPGPFEAYMRAGIRGGSGDDGFISRFQLAVWPDVSRDWRNVDDWPNAQARQTAFAVFQEMNDLDVSALGAVIPEEAEDGIPFLRFSAAAQPVFDAWRESLEIRLRADEDHPAFENHLAKYRSLVPSLALLLHLVDGHTGPVELESLERAIRWAVLLESHAARIYSVASNPAASAAAALAKRILARKVGEEFTARDVYKNGWTGLKHEDVELALPELVELNWLVAVEVKTRGRSKTTFKINPAVFSLVDPFERGNSASPKKKSHTPPGATDKTDTSSDEGTSDSFDGSVGDELPSGDRGTL